MVAAILGLCALALASAEIGAKLRFTEVAGTSGIRAAMRCGGPEKRWIPEANGSGAAWLDYDNDGLPDLLIVNGGNMEQLRQITGGNKPVPAEGGVYLYHNQGTGHFEDVTKQAGLANPYWGTGTNAADYNNDGFTDILITSIGLDLLYRNNGNGTFTEVGRAAGLRQTVEWHTGSAFGDFDNDGRLDLFIAGYLDLHALTFKEPVPVCDYFGQHVFCGPLGLKGGRSVLYHNNGDGTFSDITERSGIAGAPPAHGFTAVAGDFNGDGKLDVFVANDSDPNFLFLNKGNGTFQKAALDRGMAFNADGQTQSNMGVAVGEYGGSGHLDVLTTVFSKDYFPLFRQGPSGAYEESAAAAGLAAVTMNYLGWSCGLTDFDNSGRRDFWTANGHVYPTDRDYNEPVTIFRSLGNKTELAYQYPAKLNNSYRGGAAADFNNDGKMDLLILPIAGLPVLLKNDTPDTNNWLGLQLRGTRSNRDAIGATLTVESCGQKQADAVRSGGSYLSRNDSRLHFGVGPCKQVERVTIQWPTGKTQMVSNLPLNRYVTLEEPK